MISPVQIVYKKSTTININNDYGINGLPCLRIRVQE